MKKRIYKSMLVLALTTILLTSFLITGVMYRAFYLRMQQEIRNEAIFISSAYNLIGQEFFSRFADQENSSRITWVASDGTVCLIISLMQNRWKITSIGRKLPMR